MLFVGELGIIGRDIHYSLSPEIHEISSKLLSRKFPGYRVLSLSSLEDVSLCLEEPHK